MSDVEARPSRIDPLDLVALVGLVLLSGGIWWIYKPAALIVVGVVLLFYAFFIARASIDPKKIPERETS